MTKPEISKILTISTAHVSQGTLDLLDVEPDANNLGLAVYPKSDFGYIIYLPEPEDNGLYHISPSGRPQFGFVDSVPDDLQSIMQYCSDLGCDILCLDCDAIPTPYLTRYYADEDTGPADILDTPLCDSDIPYRVVKRLAMGFYGLNTPLKDILHAGTNAIADRTALPAADIKDLQLFFAKMGYDLCE